MYEFQEPYRQKVMSLHKSMMQLDEPADPALQHSQSWCKLHDDLCAISVTVVRLTWQKPVQYIQAHDVDDSYIRDAVDSILKHFKPGTLQKGKHSGKQKEVSFWDYYILILRNTVYRKQSKIKVKEAARNRDIPISERKQRKINRMLFIFRTLQAHNPSIKKLQDCRTAFLDDGICKNDKELDELFKLNTNTFMTMQMQADENETADQDENLHHEPSIDDWIDIEQTLNAFWDKLDEAFVRKMSLKRQAHEKQMAKETFMRDIITCHYLHTVITRFGQHLTVEDIVSMMNGHQFASRTVLDEFLKKEQVIRKRIQQDGVKAALGLKEFAGKDPVTVQSLSIAHNMPVNYGHKRMTDFRKFAKKLFLETEVDQVLLELV